MTYVRAWDEFLARSEALFRDSPTKTRYTIKYRHCSGKLVLKVTDDKECLLYKTDQIQDLKKMEKMNNLFFILMTKGAEATVEDLEAGAAPEPTAPAAHAKGGRKNRRRG